MYIHRYMFTTDTLLQLKEKIKLEIINVTETRFGWEILHYLCRRLL